LAESLYHITGAAFAEQLHTVGPKVFDQLFSELYPSLCVVADRYINNREVARDLVADLFLSLWKDRHKLSSITDMASFLYRTTRNRSFSYLRDQQVVKKHEISLKDTAANQEPSLLEQRVFEAEYIKLLYKAIEELPPECKRVVKLGLEGATTAQIAEQLGVTPAAVSNQKNRAIRLLRFKIPLPVLLVIALGLFPDR
jgi:RNA polymerase sigma-70 factor (family 1)